jgi:hypothetical protein
MARTAGSGKRYQTRRIAKTAVVEPPNWAVPERIVGNLSGEAKSAIHLVCELYALTGSQHDPRQTILASDVTPLLKHWLEASEKLKSAIATDQGQPTDKTSEKIDERPLSRADIIARFSGDSTVRRIGKMLPLQFLKLIVSAAADAAAVFTNELQESPTAIKDHLWEAWVVLIADTLRTNGIKVSASLRTKIPARTSSEPDSPPAYFSPFLRLILHLQHGLPKDCRRLLSDETFCNAVQKAIRGTRHLKREDLMIVLAGHGAGLLGILPGGLKGLEPNQTEKLQAMLRIDAAR